MIENSYDRGDAPRITRNFAGIDPDTVTFLVITPANGETAYIYGIDPQIVKADDGIYYVDVDANLEGVWQIRWESTDPQTAKEEQFIVRHSNF